jgi:hypothetical protein
MSEVTVFERAVLDGINALKQDEIVDAFFYEELSMEGLKKYPDDFAEIAKFAASLDLTDFKMVDSYGGEGQGDTYYRIFKFESGDKVAHIKFDGYYSSYDGADYQQAFLVEPKEVTVIEYFKK